MSILRIALKLHSVQNLRLTHRLSKRGRFAKVSRLLLIILVSLLLLYPFTGLSAADGTVQGKTPARHSPEAKPTADGSDDPTWQNIETKHTIIHYQTLDDLKTFNKKVVYYSARLSLKHLFSPSGSDNLTDNLKKKVDALYERVQEILDMRKRMKKIIINIYHDKKQLHATFYKIYRKKCLFRALYIYKYNTVYINVENLHEGMLAHEMAHAIIDHYFSARPPKATAEILARYADRHLLD